MLMPASNLADDLFAPVEDIPPSRTEGFVVCELAALTIAIPQVDIVTIEHGSELSAPLPGEQVVGWFGSAHGPWPAYALDSQLHATRSASSPFLVFVKSHPWPAGLLCDSVRIVGARSELDVQPLPAAMRDGSGAICGVARIDDTRLALIFGEGRLAGHLAEIATGGVRHE